MSNRKRIDVQRKLYRDIAKWFDGMQHNPESHPALEYLTTNPKLHIPDVRSSHWSTTFDGIDSYQLSRIHLAIQAIVAWREYVARRDAVAEIRAEAGKALAGILDAATPKPPHAPERDRAKRDAV